VGEQGVELRAGLGSESSLKDFRKDVLIEVYNEAGSSRSATRCSAPGFGIPGAADLDCERECRRDPAPQAGERRLGPRYRDARAGRAKLHRTCLIQGELWSADGHETEHQAITVPNAESLLRVWGEEKP